MVKVSHPRSKPAAWRPAWLLSQISCVSALFLIFGGLVRDVHAESGVLELPAGVEPVWDISKAYHETTPTRERICLNGLWQWQSAYPNAKSVPAQNWGYFKVPGCWPGITDYMQKDCQTVYAHPSWSGKKLGEINAAWYQREFTIPKNWAGRRVFISLEYLNSFAAVYLDGRPVAEARFPGADVELTAALHGPGPHHLALLVIALPLKAVVLSYTDSESAREQKGAVARRGLCGDVFLVSMPAGPRLTDVSVQTSVQNKTLTIAAMMEGLAPQARYKLKALVRDGPNVVTQFTSPSFQTTDLKHGRLEFAQSWLPDKLWDLRTPQNQYDLDLGLLGAGDEVLDTAWKIRFGFRELWIKGRDFYLNGSRIFLSAVPLDNAQVSAELATYPAARESMERLKAMGINFVYTHNYGCEPGDHLGFEEILRAADDTGMLVSFSQPHFSHYDWKAPDADEKNGYARHAAYYVRVAQNHPSVVMYSMSHNATGYDEDMNPDLIDGIHAPRDSWALKNVALATRAQKIVSGLDPSRIVYHHASGNLGPMHAINFYPNFVPIQELSDWFEHWSTQGVKPVFTCEYGAPFTWDWTMYRGWYQGQREFGSAAVPWEFCLAEWNAQFYGDRAFDISEAERRNLRWEAAQLRAGKLWHRWDYPVEVGSTRFDERYPIFAMYLKDNWRAFRTWEVSAVSPWEFEHFWKLREGVDRRRVDFRTDWQNLQRPGFSPDYEEQRYERMDLAYKRSDWVPTIAAKTLMANNAPLLSYLAGKPSAFTSKDHIFHPGERVEKQVILINNSRETVSGGCEWTYDGPGTIGGSDTFSLPTGQQKRLVVSFVLPASSAIGVYQLKSMVKFSTGEVQTDSLAIDVVAKPAPAHLAGKIALFDPKGQTAALLKELGISIQQVQADADLAGIDLLIVGKEALTVGGAAPDIHKVEQGLKVLVFEQTADALEKRLGFRVEEYGLRQVYARVPDHPALAGIGEPQLHDWRGEATLVTPRLQYISRPRYGPTIEWCGLSVPHLWRCGTRGSVASVLIEKPVKGDFLPILDGGYSLQYSPLIEYHRGAGLILFCQVDVTGRTEPEPAADALVRNLLAYVDKWKPRPARNCIYIGNPEGKRHLEDMGVPVAAYEQGKLSNKQVLVAGPGSGKVLAADASGLANWLKEGGDLLAIGMDQTELNSFLPQRVATKSAEHISAFFPVQGLASFAAGIGPADLHNRDPRSFPLIDGEAEVLGDGVLARDQTGHVILCQMAPWTFTDEQPNLKRTHRRASFMLTRLLANLGVAAPMPLLEYFHEAQADAHEEWRWLRAYYADKPEEWDDPYRHFRW